MKAKTSNAKNKYTGKQFIFFGINYMIGYGFIVGMSSAYGNLGLFYLVALMVCGLIIFCVGLNYANISRLFPKSYGASYLISRKAFGKFGGFMNGWIQYIQSPVIVVASVSGIVWAFQNINLFGMQIDANWLHKYGWVLAIFSALIFWCLSIVLTFGFNATKIAIIVFSILKWSFVFLTMALALFLIFKNIVLHPEVIVKNFTSYVWPKNAHFSNIVFGTFTIFFAMGGIDGIASMNADVQDPEKTVPKAIFWTIICTVGFYFIFFLIMILALGAYGDNGMLPGNLDPTSSSKTNAPNPVSFVINSIFIGGLAMAFNIYLVITQIANKCTNRLQGSWIFSRSLISLSANGTLPHNLIKVDLKKNQFTRCIWLDFFIGFSLTAIYIFIMAFDQSLSEKLDNSFDALSLQLTCLYSYTAFCTLWCVRQKTIKLNKINIASTMFAAIATSILAILFVIFKIQDFVITKDSSDLLSIIFFAFLMLVGIFVYLIGKACNWESKPFPESWSKYLNANPHLDVTYKD